jgi:phospholipid/cholesterol/gamma-HCH transport system substrate-binding protein
VGAVSEHRPGLKFVVFGVVCAACLVWLAMVTGNFRFLPTTVSYEAVLEDATGLAQGDSVLLAGVRVGRVQHVAIEQGRALVTFNVDRDVQLRDTWEVGARWRNVIGQRYLYLFPAGDGNGLAPGSRIPVERSRPTADIGRFFERLAPILRAIDPEQQNVLLLALNEALDGKEERTQQLVSDLGSLTGTLADREPEVRTILREGSALLDAYAQREAEIQGFLDDFADVSATLAARNDELVGAVVDIAEVQRQLDAMLRANDADIRTLVGDLEHLLGIVGDNRGDFERAVANTKEGLATYMLISRWGQWFNVRAVAVQVQFEGETICITEGGEACHFPNAPGSGPAAASSSSRVPVPVDGLAAVAGAALGERPGDGVRFAREHGPAAVAVRTP